MLSNGEMLKRLEDVIIDEQIDPEEKIILIRSEFAGYNLYFPQRNINYANIKERNKAIKTDYLSGVTISELMQKYNLSESRLYKIINSYFL